VRLKKTTAVTRKTTQAGLREDLHAAMHEEQSAAGCVCYVARGHNSPQPCTHTAARIHTHIDFARAAEACAAKPFITHTPPSSRTPSPPHTPAAPKNTLCTCCTHRRPGSAPAAAAKQSSVQHPNAAHTHMPPPLCQQQQPPKATGLQQSQALSGQLQNPIASQAPPPSLQSLERPSL
jgi:hypothetical protein